MPHAMYKRYCDGFVSLGTGGLPTLDQMARGVTHAITPSSRTPNKIPKSTPTRTVEHHQLQQDKHNLQLKNINNQISEINKTPTVQQDSKTQNNLARLQHRQAYHSQMTQLHSNKVAQMSGLPHNSSPAKPSPAAPGVGKPNSAPQPTPKSYSMPIPQHLQGFIKPPSGQSNHVTSRTLDAEARSIYSKKLLPGETHQNAGQRHHEIANEHYNALKNMHDQFRRTKGGFLSKGWHARRQLMKQMKYHKGELDKQVALRDHHYNKHLQEQKQANPGRGNQQHTLPGGAAPTNQPSNQSSDGSDSHQSPASQQAPAKQQAAQQAPQPAKQPDPQEPDDDEVQHPPHGGDLTKENGDFMHDLTPSDAHATAVKYKGTDLAKAHFSGQAFPGSSASQMATYHKGQAQLHNKASQSAADQMLKEKSGLKRANLENARNVHSDRATDHAQFASKWGKEAKRQATVNPPAAAPENSDDEDEDEHGHTQDSDGSQQAPATHGMKFAPGATPNNKTFGKRTAPPEQSDQAEQSKLAPAAPAPQAQAPNPPAPAKPTPLTDMTKSGADGNDFANLKPRDRFEKAVAEPNHPIAQAHFHNKGNVPGITDNPKYQKQQADYHQKAGNLHRQNGNNAALDSASREKNFKKADMHDQLFLHHKNMAAKQALPAKAPQQSKPAPVEAA